MSVPLKVGDPAYWMLEKGLADPSWRSKRHVPIYKGCYICEDPEFELMGLPLCYSCPVCSLAVDVTGKVGHVPADDVICDMCGYEVDPYEGAE